MINFVVRHLKVVFYMQENPDHKEQMPQKGSSKDDNQKVEISIKEFIEKKRLQNKILGELIEKIQKSNSESLNQ